VADVETRVPAMAWCRHDGDDDFIYWSPSTTVAGPELQWPEAQVLRDRRCSTSPTISGSGPGALMAWKGSGDDTRIWLSEWDTAAGAWGPQRPTPFTTHYSPTLVRYQDHTFIFFRTVPPRDEPGLKMMWAEYVDGTWRYPFREDLDVEAELEFVFTNSVSGVSYEHLDGLAIAWQNIMGPEGGQQVDNFARFQILTNGTWGSDDVNGAVVGDMPALTSDGNVLHLAWRDTDEGNIWWAYSAGGSWVGHQKLTDRATSATPALAAIGMGDVVMVWKGVAGDPRMWWSRLRDNVWSPQQPFPDSQHEMHTNTWAAMF
jgi:hypothetical protein